MHADLTRVSDGVRLEVHDQGGPGPVVHRRAGHDQPVAVSISSAGSRRTGGWVSLASSELDPYGLPVARFDYTLGDNYKASMAYSSQVIKELLDAAGAQDVLTIERFAHLVGGARMGTSPADSVVDANQLAWGIPNLFISDGSVCPTQGAANPALTIMALASRLAERIISGGATSPADK